MQQQMRAGGGGAFSSQLPLPTPSPLFGFWSCPVAESGGGGQGGREPLGLGGQRQRRDTVSDWHEGPFEGQAGVSWCSPGRDSGGERREVVQKPGAPGTGQLPFAKPTRKLKRWLSVHTGTLGGRRAGTSQRHDGAPGSREGLCGTNDRDPAGSTFARGAGRFPPEVHSKSCRWSFELSQGWALWVYAPQPSGAAPWPLKEASSPWLSVHPSQALIETPGSQRTRVNR